MIQRVRTRPLVPLLVLLNLVLGVATVRALLSTPEALPSNTASPPEPLANLTPIAPDVGDAAERYAELTEHPAFHADRTFLEAPAIVAEPVRRDPPDYRLTGFFALSGKPAKAFLQSAATGHTATVTLGERLDEFTVVGVSAKAVHLRAGATTYEVGKSGVTGSRTEGDVGDATPNVTVPTRTAEVHSAGPATGVSDVPWPGSPETPIPVPAYVLAGPQTSARAASFPPSLPPQGSTESPAHPNSLQPIPPAAAPGDPVAGPLVTELAAVVVHPHADRGPPIVVAPKNTTQLYVLPVTPSPQHNP